MVESKNISVVERVALKVVARVPVLGDRVAHYHVAHGHVARARLASGSETQRFMNAVEAHKNAANEADLVRDRTAVIAHKLSVAMLLSGTKESSRGDRGTAA